MKKADLENALASRLVEKFNQSGIAYTCAAVVFGEIGCYAEKWAMDARSNGTNIKGRRLMNIALERIHEKHCNA